MAADFTNQQLDLVQRLKTASQMFNDAMNAAMVLHQEAIDSGFAPGGANAITDQVLATRFPNLTVADLTNVFAAFAAADTTMAANSRAYYKAIVRAMR